MPLHTNVMRITTLALTIALASSAAPTCSGQACNAQYLEVCKQLGQDLPAGTVLYAGESGFEEGRRHAYLTSDDLPACVVRPANAEEVSVIIKQVGKTKTPFAIKSGGHTTNPGFSSTKGVHIALSKLNSNQFANFNTELVMGAGQVWDTAYAFLEGSGRNVVGGRVAGIGAGGFAIAGGGYSWLTNERGLTIDTITAFELVKPNGDIINVTETSEPDLFFALRGGGNSFGIVTKMTLKTFPQPAQVWGGITFHGLDQAEALSQAVQTFDKNNKDPKAAVLPAFTNGALFLITFYNGPTPPAGTFDMFTSLPVLLGDVKTRTFSNFIANALPPSEPLRSTYHTVPVLKYTKRVMDVIVAQTNLYAQKFTGTGDQAIIVTEPFDSRLYDQSRGGAYPHDKSKPVTPLNIAFQWSDPSKDAAMRKEAQKVFTAIRQAAIADGQNIAAAPLYPNYSPGDTPVAQMYGGPNLARLRQIKKAVDPQNVMGLAGGFKF